MEFVVYLSVQLDSWLVFRREIHSKPSKKGKMKNLIVFLMTMAVLGAFATLAWSY